MSQAETSAAAQDAALRALNDACEDSSVRFPALWKSEESGFEPMEWDSYQKANYCPGRVGEYGGGRVFTTASRMEVRRSEERLPDGSVLATEERTAAGAATRASPPPPGTCPASPPRGASAAVGATERRVTWSPPPAASSPCACVSPSRRRVALPCSPPSPISSPCRRIRIRSPTCSMTPDSLEVSRSRTPDSLEVSRSRRRSLRSPRRSFSAESIIPCPASGWRLDSVTPPSGLRFSGSAGLSPCVCATPSPCPASRSRRRTSSPLTVCPAARGSVTPPSGILATPCPSYSGTGIDSETPPSGLFSGSPCPCSPGRRSSTPPPCSPAPCLPPPCSPAPCLPPPCSPDPYSNIGRPKRFFQPKGRRSSTPPPCAPSPCSPPPCAPAPCLPPPCSPDPYANIGRPKRYFSPLAALAKSASMEYDDDPFYGIGNDDSSCLCTSLSLSPGPAHVRGNVPKGFYSLTGDVSASGTSPRRTEECPARSPSPPPSPAPCPATTTCEVECTPGGVVRRSYSRDCPSSPSTGGVVSKVASASFAMTSPSPNPDPEDFSSDPGPLWEDLSDLDEGGFIREEEYTFLDRGPNRFDFPPDDTFYEIENRPCPIAESTRICPASYSRSRSPSPVPECCYSPPPPPPCSPPPPPPCSPPRSPLRCPRSSLIDSLSPLSSLRSSDYTPGSMSPVQITPPGGLSPVRQSPPRTVREEYITMPLQESLGSWYEPGPMWGGRPPNPDNSIDCGPDISGYGTLSFLDRTVPSFSYPPIHPRRRRC